MKKFFMVACLVLMVTVSGCTGSKNNVNANPKEVKVWWGTKAEIVAFLETPGARSNNWFIQALGGE